jgi:hypothetical protein
VQKTCGVSRRALLHSLKLRSKLLERPVRSGSPDADDHPGQPIRSFSLLRRAAQQSTSTRPSIEILLRLFS